MTVATCRFPGPPLTCSRNMSIRSTRCCDMSIGRLWFDTFAEPVECIDATRSLATQADWARMRDRGGNRMPGYLPEPVRKQQAEAAKLDGAIAVNLKELGYGG